MGSIYDISNEILEHILEYSNFNDISNLMLTCSNFYQIRFNFLFLEQAPAWMETKQYHLNRYGSEFALNKLFDPYKSVKYRVYARWKIEELTPQWGP